MSDPIVIVGIARTAMGGMNGLFAETSASELGGRAIAGALEDSGLAPDQVSEVLMGCVLPAGVGQAPARQAALTAGLPKSVPTATVNKVCGSGMKTVMMARDSLLAGTTEVVVAGGMENMTRAPYMLTKARSGYRLGHGEILDHMFIDGLQDAYQGQLMGNFAEATAEKYAFTREQQDEFAIHSLNKATAAIDQGLFKREIVPITLSTRKGEITIATDEQPGNARIDKIPTLKPAFKKDGTVTAANASSISDGAAALVLMKASTAKARGLTPIAEIKAQAQHAHEPEWFTTAPVGAIKKVMEQANWSSSEVDLYEINEAFAVVTMAAITELGLDAQKVNVHGGACALGHPLGASGARILVTLIAALQTYGKKRGIASLCIGGGEATALAVELL